MTSEHEVARLQVDGKALIGGLNSAKRMKGLGRSRAALHFKDGKLIVAFEQMRFSVPASGNWTGVAKVTKAFLTSLPPIPIDNVKDFTISVQGNTIDMGGFSGKCQWVSDNT